MSLASSETSFAYSGHQNLGADTLSIAYAPSFSTPRFCARRNACLLVDALPDAPSPIPGGPAGSGDQVVPDAAASFVVHVSNSWCPALVDGNSISATFSPNLAGIDDLSALARLGGFDHFNIEQDITEISGAEIPALLPRWTGVDPALGGNTFSQFDDQFPWYYDEVRSTGGWMPLYDDPSILLSDPQGTAIGLVWRDAPNLSSQNIGVTLSFSDYLVGVYADHTGARISDLFPGAQNVNFKWTFKQGHWGKKGPDLFRFARFDQREPGSKGSVRFLGYFGSDASFLAVTSGRSCSP